MTEFLFVVTYGRSGSTLLNGVLNSLPGVRVYGENNMAVKHLWSFYREMVKSFSASENFEQNFGQFDSCNSWNNPVDYLQLQESTRSFFLDVYDPDRMFDLIGFKEIRYPSMSKGELFSFLRWLDYVFVPAKFVFLTRSLDETCKSKWHAIDSAKCRERLDRFTLFLREYYDSFCMSQDLFCLHFDSLHDDSLQALDFRPLVDWLGLCFDEESIDEVLCVRHGY